MTVYARPGAADALMSYESRYGNFIGGRMGAAGQAANTSRTRRR